MSTLTKPGAGRITAALAAFCAVAAAAPGVIVGLRLNTDLWSHGLLNPDSAMRLVRLDDIVAAGRPLHAVMRDGSGAGTVLHWSHFLDTLLLLLAAPFVPLLGWHDAIHLAGLASGPLVMAALGIAIAWAILPVTDRAWLWLGAFTAGAAPVLGGYGMMGVVHHHVALVLTAILAAGHAIRVLRGADPVACGLSMGAAAAAGLWLSPEALPFALMATGAVWATWLHTPSTRLVRCILASSLAFLLLTTLIIAVDPPASGWKAVEMDRISLPFAWLALGAAAAAVAAALTGRRLVPLLVGGAGAVLWLLAFPDLLRGTSGLMTAEEAQAFFGGITEMAPVHGLDEVLESLLGGIFATAALLVMAVRRRGPLAATLFYAGLCAAATVVLAALHVRFTSYPSTAGAAVLPIVVTRISARQMAPVLQSLARVTVILVMILTPPLAPLAKSAEARAAAPTTDSPCKLAGAIGLLQDHPGTIVLAGVNETPDLLYRAPVRTVGSLYHRNPAGFLRLRAAWREVPGDTPGPAFRATGASLVLGCPHDARSSVVEGMPRTTLLDRLIADAPPPWLEPVANAGPGGFVLYAVRNGG